jgi:precorrin-6B C5,15-methyltransferase / cobalt-precorrin-6B C5,C15-methyltransferase
VSGSLGWPAVTSVISVVGIGADGWDGLATQAREAVLDAEVLLGGRRHLSMLPPVDARLVPWPSPLLERLPGLLEEYAGRRLVVLASGDPLVSGIGTTLVSLLGADAVRVVPAVSSVALARARMGWSAESADVVTVVGRDPAVVARHLSPGRRLVVLSSDGRTPALLAGLLVESGFGTSPMSVLSDLGSADEDRRDLPASAWVGREAPRLNVACIEVWPERPDLSVRSVVGGLDDGVFEHDGQLTKRDLRTSALARLAPVPGQLLWDVGAGAGSVGIEWMRTDPRCRAVAVESDVDRAARIGRNATRLGVPGLEVHRARAPEGLADLPAPDAVFVGGGASRPGVLDVCWEALSPGGRLVVHAVTLETEQRLVELYRRRGGELTRLSVEHAEPIGTFTGWSPARPVVQWAVTKKDER